MDMPSGKFEDIDLVKDTPAPSPQNSLNDEQNIPNESKSPEESPSSIQDIEFGSKVMLYFDFFANVKDFFEISTTEYFDRCLTALYPYLCISLSFTPLFKTIKTIVTTRRFNFREHLKTLNSHSHLSRSGSDDSIKLNLEHSETQSDLNLSFVKEDSTDSISTTTGASFSPGLKLKQGSKWFMTLRSMIEYPDLYAPFCVNLMASSSLFFSSCLGLKMGSRHSLLTLSVLYELSFLSMSCTVLMALSIFLCKYLFTKEAKVSDFISFFCVCGYTQIPLALLCKACIIISLFMFFHPLHYVLLVLKGFTYFYLFISTTCTLFISLPPLAPGKRSFAFKLLSILSSYTTQAIFLTLIQKYIH